jgi:putative membrane protein
MIEKYSDHSANERTFLAWVRTGIAMITFGLAMGKVNLLIWGLEQRVALAPGHNTCSWTRSFGHLDGLLLIFGGMSLIAVATWRFVRIRRLIDAPEVRSAGGILAEIGVSIVLVTATIATFISLH